MANTQSASFIAQFEDEVKVAFQRKTSLLQNAVFKVNASGSTVEFPYLGAVVANTKARNAEVTILEPAHSRAIATMQDFYASVLWDRLDQEKTNQDLRSAYVETVTGSIHRKLDEIIVTAMLAGTQTIPTATGGWTKARHFEAIQRLSEQDVPDEDRFMIATPAMITALYNIPEFTNKDYQDLSPAMDGKIGRLFGINVIKSTGLTPVAGTTTGIYWNKRSVGLGINSEPKVSIDYIPMRDSTLIKATVSAGAVIVDPAGVVEVAYTL